MDDLGQECESLDTSILVKFRTEREWISQPSDPTKTVGSFSSHLPQQAKGRWGKLEIVSEGAWLQDQG